MNFEMPEPLHPAVVHFPLALAILLPLVTLVICMGMWMGGFQRRTWILVVLLQALLVGSAWYAKKTGSNEATKVEAVTGQDAVTAHEEKAELFFYVAIGSAALSLVTVFMLGSKKAAGWGGTLTFVATLATAYFALETGRLGGDLVWKHGAADAYRQETPAPTEPTPTEPDPPDED